MYAAVQELRLIVAMSRIWREIRGKAKKIIAPTGTCKDNLSISAPCMVCLKTPPMRRSAATLGELIESAAKGKCLRCTQLYEGLCRIGDESSLRDLGFGLLDIDCTGNVYLIYPSAYGFRDKQPYELVVSRDRTRKSNTLHGNRSLQHARVDTSTLLHLKSYDLISGDLVSDQAIRWARDALLRCTETHDMCATKRTERRPARLLDLDWKDDRIRLRDFETAHKRYACLSHCWGDLQECKTKRADLKRYKEEGVTIASLSKTLKDTIDFLRRLGDIRFLWIDSLCIIQDDEFDRNREIAAMCDIYQGCWICIAATAARDGSDGLFPDIPLIYRGFPLRSDLAEEGVIFRQRIDHTNFITDDSLSSKPYPLLNRAWVFQERRLAPRILHFTSYELIWECSTVAKCECTRMEDEARQWKPDFALFDRKKADPVRFWHVQVKEYSKLTLSRPSDTLPAIGGLAQEVSPTRKVRYLAGLWEDSLIQDLAWCNSHSHDQAPKPSTWRAPSWSWASIDNQVEFYQISNSECEVVSVDCESADGTNPFGEVVSGILMLYGPTVEVNVCLGGTERFGKVSAHGGEGRDFSRDYSPNEELQRQVQSGDKKPCLLLIDDHRSLVLMPILDRLDTYERIGFCFYGVKSYREEAKTRTITII